MFVSLNEAGEVWCKYLKLCNHCQLGINKTKNYN